MESIGIGFSSEIFILRNFIDSNNLSAKILATLFKTKEQIVTDVNKGVHYCTINPLILSLAKSEQITKDTLQFSKKIFNPCIIY